MFPKYSRSPKYRNKKTVFEGRSYASGLERDVFCLLQLLEKAGEVKDIRQQESVYLTAARIQYIVDFSLWDLKLNEKVWVEAKGFSTDVWKIKCRLWQAGYGPGRLHIYRASKSKGGTPWLSDEILPRATSAII